MQHFGRFRSEPDIEEPPSGEAWLHEIKHDGFRVIARKDGNRVRLYSLPGNEISRTASRSLSRPWLGCAHAPASSMVKPSLAVTTACRALIASATVGMTPASSSTPSI